MKRGTISLTFLFLNVLFFCFPFLNCSGGGHVITPTKHGKPSIVKHMLAIDWKFWKPYLKKGASVSITIRVLERIAGILLCTNKKWTFYFILSFYFSLVLAFT